MSKDSSLQTEDDPFDIFSLPPRFDLSPEVIEKAYISIQKQIHPDEFVLHSELVRQAAARHSSRVNKAYEHLKNPLMRAEFLLKQKGYWPIPSSFDVLSEAMDLGEEGLKSQDSPAFQKKVNALYEESYSSITLAFSKGDWPRAAEEYLRLSYLGKIRVKE